MGSARRGPFLVRALLSVSRMCERRRCPVIRVQRPSFWVLLGKRQNEVDHRQYLSTIRKPIGWLLDPVGQPRQEYFALQPPYRTWHPGNEVFLATAPGDCSCHYSGQPVFGIVLVLHLLCRWRLVLGP